MAERLKAAYLRCAGETHRRFESCFTHPPIYFDNVIKCVVEDATRADWEISVPSERGISSCRRVGLKIQQKKKQFDVRNSVMDPTILSRIQYVCHADYKRMCHFYRML
jgi:hypothetical protein